MHARMYVCMYVTYLYKQCIYKVVQKSLDTSGNILIKLYWHSFHIFFMFMRPCIVNQCQ